MAEITQTLINFVTKVSYDHLPPPVVQKTKQILLDSIGCALGSYVVDRASIAIEITEDLGGKPQASVIGNRKTSCALAAFANGELIQALDYEPIGPLIPHTVPYVIPPSLAIAERRCASGKDLIMAIALGLEIGGRAGSSVVGARILKESPPYYEQSERYSYIPAIFGAVASVCKLLHLDNEKTANAFGIACANAPLPAMRKWKEITGPSIMCKFNLWTGWVTQLAVTAVLAAEKGFTGDTAILDGEWGFWKFYGSPFFKPDILLGKLGTAWHVGEVKFKTYPICAINHAGVYAINKVIQQNEIDPEHIESILLEGDHMLLLPHHGQSEIKSFADAQFSNAYIMAVAAYYGCSPGPGWQAPETLAEPKIKDLMKKIKVTLHPKAEETIRSKNFSMPDFFGSAVEVTAGGKKFRFEVPEAENPMFTSMTDEELKEKFKNNASYSTIQSDRTVKAMEMIYKLEEVEDITALMDLLTLD